MSTAYHPQTDGLTERSNQELETHLRTYCSYMQDDWVKWLPMAEFADNNATASATGVSPFYANKGFHPRMSFSSDDTSYASTRQRLDALRAQDITTKMEEILIYIRHNMEDTREVMARQANKHRTEASFNPGDMVFLSTKNITTIRPSRKLDDKRVGPFKVLDKVGTAYRLELPTTIKRHNVFHPSLLTLASTNPLQGQHNPPPEPVITKDDEQWVVEDILDSKRVYGRLKYRVKWEHVDQDLTWWNADNNEFEGSQDVVDAFHEKYPHKPKPSERRGRRS